MNNEGLNVYIAIFTERQHSECQSLTDAMYFRLGVAPAVVTYRGQLALLPGLWTAHGHTYRTALIIYCQVGSIVSQRLLI